MKTKNLKRTFTTLIFTAIFFNSYSQLSITSYSIYAIGVNTNQSKTISGELKAFTNTDIMDLLLEADMFYNFKPKASHRFSIGIGINGIPLDDSNLIKNITIPAQLEIYPLQKFKNLSIIFELTPEFDLESDWNLRNLWGIKYTFRELKK